LERSFNNMAEELGTLIAGVQRESGQVAEYAERLRDAVERLGLSGGEFRGTAATLSTRLGEQRAHTEQGRRQAMTALDAAGRLREQAGETERDARSLVDAARESRAAIGE